MRTLLTMSLAFATLLVSLVSAGADSPTVKWEDIVGIIQPGNLVGTGTGQITGAGQPWTAQSGKAQIDLGTGRLKFTVNDQSRSAHGSSEPMDTGPVTQELRMTNYLTCKPCAELPGGQTGLWFLALRSVTGSC